MNMGAGGAMRRIADESYADDGMVICTRPLEPVGESRCPRLVFLKET